jgi:hypothetical protein
MPKKPEQMDRVCGNCRYHNAYDYPDTVFCFAKFSNKEKAVVSILSSCDEWENKLQECCCLEDHLKKQGKKH